MSASPVSPPPAVSAAEQSSAARIGAIIFRHRGWLPLLFLGVPLLAPGRITALGWLIGGALIAVGEAVRMAGDAAAGSVTRRRSRTVQRLVTYGIFAWMRNPLYVGNFLIWVGFVVISGVLWFDAGEGTELHLFTDVDETSGRSPRHPCLRVRDLASLGDRLRAAGVEILEPGDDIPGRRRLFAFDPFGNAVELAEFS